MSTSEAKKQASRINGAKGGRPVKRYVVQYYRGPTDGEMKLSGEEEVDACSAKAAVNKIKYYFKLFGKLHAQRRFRWITDERYEAQDADWREYLTASLKGEVK